LHSGYLQPICYGIDYNLVELLPDGVPFWNWLKHHLMELSFLHRNEFSHQGTKSDTLSIHYSLGFITILIFLDSILKRWKNHRKTEYDETVVHLEEIIYTIS